MDVGKIIMGIIAGTLVACSAIVLIFKGVDAMPFGIIGVIGAAVFVALAIVFIKISPPHPDHGI